VWEGSKQARGVWSAENTHIQYPIKKKIQCGGKRAEKERDPPGKGRLKGVVGKKGKTVTEKA